MEYRDKVMEFMKLFPWIVAIINIFGCFLNAKKRIECWPIWMGTAICNSWYFIFYKSDYGVALVWVGYLFFNIYGWYEWGKKDKKII